MRFNAHQQPALEQGRMPTTLKPLWAALLLTLAPAAQAADYTWQGGSGNWTDSNWNQPGYPDGAANNAYIDNGNPASSTVNLDTNATVGLLSVDSGDSLGINSGNVLGVTSGTNNYGTVSGGTIQGNGTATLAGSGGYQNLTLQGGFNLNSEGTYNTVSFNDSNTVLNGFGSQLNLVGGTNNGNLTLDNGSFVWASGTVSNNGTINANGWRLVIKMLLDLGVERENIMLDDFGG